MREAYLKFVTASILLAGITVSTTVRAAGFYSLPVNHTHTAPILEPHRYIEAAGEFKTAAIWWLPDWQDKLEKRKSDGDSGTGGGDPTRNCASYGYQSSCPGGQSGEQIIVTASLSCYKNCSCDSSYQYNSSNCKPPYYLAGTTCSDAGGTKYKNCNLNVEEACRGYSKTCPSGWQLESGGRCSYDSSYGTCCNQCAGYDYASIPEGYVELGRCDSCSGIKYKIKENPCDGFTTCQYGAAVGARICKTGSTVKYSECKKCLFECTLNSCPAHTTCRYEDCSGRYCATGCEVNYVDLDNYWCNGALRCWWQ